MDFFKNTFGFSIGKKCRMMINSFSPWSSIYLPTLDTVTYFPKYQVLPYISTRPSQSTQSISLVEGESLLINSSVKFFDETSQKKHQTILAYLLPCDSGDLLVSLTTTITTVNNIRTTLAQHTEIKGAFFWVLVFLPWRDNLLEYFTK